MEQKIKKLVLPSLRDTYKFVEVRLRDHGGHMSKTVRQEQLGLDDKRVFLGGLGLLL